MADALQMSETLVVTEVTRREGVAVTEKGLPIALAPHGSCKVSKLRLTLEEIPFSAKILDSYLSH